MVAGSNPTPTYLCLCLSASLSLSLSLCLCLSVSDIYIYEREREREKINPHFETQRYLAVRLDLFIGVAVQAIRFVCQRLSLCESTKSERGEENPRKKIKNVGSFSSPDF